MRHFQFICKVIILFKNFLVFMDIFFDFTLISFHCWPSMSKLMRAYRAYSDEKIQNLEGGVLCTIHVEGVSSTGVENINATKVVSSVKYFNAAGMVSDNAFDGVNILVTTYIDGTQSVAKVVK